MTVDSLELVEKLLKDYLTTTENLRRYKELFRTANEVFLLVNFHEYKLDSNHTWWACCNKFMSNPLLCIVYHNMYFRNVASTRML
jgi:hypothetical protein